MADTDSRIKVKPEGKAFHLDGFLQYRILHYIKAVVYYPEYCKSAIEEITTGSELPVLERNDCNSWN